MGTTTRDEVLAAEQKSVDHAYDCYAARLAEMSGTAAATASASGKDGIANRADAEARAAAYGGLGTEALVFARVDAPDDPGGASRPWYIGRRGVRDAENEPVVLLWTSPLAKKWAEARPESPGDVVLRRRLRCAQRVVEDYFDEIAPPVPAPLPAADASAVPVAPVSPAVPRPRKAADDSGAETTDAPPVPAGTAAQVPAGTDAEEPAGADGPAPVPTPGDIARRRRRKPFQPDDFLLRELQRSRSGRMRDIVETIRRDQMELVTGSPSDIVVIQGGPGTGKSAVGLHRVTWLVDNGHFKAQDILVIGPHQRFLDYVGQVLPTLGTRDVNAVQLDRLWEGEVRGTDTPRARAVKSDERMAAVLRRRVESEYRPEALDDLTVAPSFEGDEPAVVVTAGSTTLRVPRSEVLALLDRAHSGDGPYRERRDRFRGLLVDRLLRELSDIAPRRGQTGTIRRDLERNRRVERLVERVWPSPGAREALRTLYDSPDLLRACADGVLDEDEQAALLRPRAASADADPWTLDDHVCLEELRVLISGETPRRYGHIVVDEAQDLTPMQARALRRRCAVGGSMTVLGDLAQATGPHIPADWDRLGALLSDHGDWNVAELGTSYRVPAEIMEFVAPLARTVAPGLPYPRAVREAGADAVRTVATEPWKLLEDTVAQVARLVGSSDGSTLRSVAVIVPDDSDWLDEIGRGLDRSGDIGDRNREAVSVLAAAQAKGMEYDHVLVVEPATIADRGPAGLRQLYVALTRSTQSLTVLHTAPLPEALTATGGSGSGSGDPGTRGSRAGEASGTPPKPAPAPLPRVGTDVRVEVVGRAPGGRYKVRPLSPGIDRPLVLTVRHGSVPPRQGEELDCWVFANETNQTVLTADQRGRSPVSERMAGRYVAALDVLAELTEHGGEVADARGRLSELQGMAGRVLRRDQADWVDVLHLLGAPGRERLGVLRDLAARTNRALKDGTLDTGRLREELAASGWTQALAEARRTLQARFATDAAPHPDGAAPHPDDAAPAAPQQPEQKDDEPMTTADSATAAPSPTGHAELLRELEAAAEADRACKKHEAVRHALKSALLWADLQPTDSPVVDVACATGRGHFLYEALGAGRSSYADLRSGATRLLEINHTLSTPADRLYLVLSGPPAEDWSADTVRGVFGVHVIWRSPQGWGGQDTDTALGSPEA
ncbi:HelD family protein [Streptomyces thermolilacinus]|uniref:ATP-dependent DNA helicase n=1 Tax=Streptomyces thermolilacinus SPC6 TaxID=1306406 RepID=A0A1D3DTR3_9ACTN|nr:ATP-binding domain-containing protein [Streptomyces thermolilacinus]OEJ95721.1 ATP-dependent DNA helicase [Streptomyces thermolilacinus SPC6]